ncbi:hypothetical protein HKBW3S47_01382 [Candidatus Hakubella thermalkaliphila]|uniref:Uncharacterized protein n=1 Tax=Candidatus Hakubella thermalkaliphila TaxID=2754717 RepID=A0A6V8Q6H7_9ACTN|nr:hypothetical protein HKBW3S47_01382 [Candidatus Hakubella thermalkaliphila]
MGEDEPELISGGGEAVLEQLRDGSRRHGSDLLSGFLSVDGIIILDAVQGWGAWSQRSSAVG